MRFFIVMAALGGIIWYAWSVAANGKGLFSTFGAPKLQQSLDDPGIVRAIKASGNPDELPTSLVPGRVGEPIQPSPPLIQSVSSTGPGPAAAVPTGELPISSLYQFQHREPPSQEQIATLQSIGLVALVDRSTRTVLLRGPATSVEAGMSFFGALDTVGGSCAVQTWAVYVDRSVQKGFDLVSAIRSVASVETSANIGKGGFTLDLDAGDVTLALSAIADGSSVEVVQRPHVRLAHGIPSKIESIQEYPVPSTTLSSGIAQTSIVYRKVGLQLDVLPYFLDRDRVILSVKQTNGLIGNNVEIQGNQVPVIQSQTVETSAELTIGQTIILGGVTTQRVRVNRGILRNTREVSEGALYVILSTYQDVPRAQPVGAPELPAPSDSTPVPFSEPMDDPRDWIDSQLLPPLLQKDRFPKARASK